MTNTKNVSLESTNTRLTGNIKLVIDTNENLFLESINSNSALSSIMFKGFNYNEEVSYGSNIKNFIAGNYMSSDLLYAVKTDNSDYIDATFTEQLSSIYKYGCYSESSQMIDENLRFFAPIYINDKENLPKHFVIYQHSFDKNQSSEFNTTKDIIDLLASAKIIKIFDLSKLQKIFKSTEKSNLYVNFDDDKNDDSIVAFGLDNSTGLNGQRLYTGFSDILNNETTMSEFNNTITNIFQNTNLLFSNIINLEFAFTDYNSDGFSNYTGVYITEEELASINELKNHKYPTKFLKGLSLVPFEKDDLIKSHKNYLGASANTIIGIEEYDEISLKFNLNPQVNETLEIYTNSRIEYQLRFSAALINKDLQITLYNICNEINLKYTGEESTIEARFNSNNEIILTSKSQFSDQLFVFTTSSVISIEKSIYSNPLKFNEITNSSSLLNLSLQTGLSISSIFNNQFKGSNNKTFVTKTLYSNARIISYQSENYTIMSIYKFNDLYYYEVDRKILVENDRYRKIEYYDIIMDVPVVGHVLSHAKLDISIEDTENYDILDFDTDEYRMYLLTKVNEPTYVGSAAEYFGHSTLTEDELIEYRTLVSAKINAYFNQISYSKNYLIKSINTKDLSSSNEMLINPYERLSENKIVELRKTNRLHQYIQKWRLDNAVDSYYNPYLLNISLAMRSDNFCSSLINQYRDLSEHTLHWFIIGSGRPPYFTTSNSSQNDRLGYTSELITEKAVKSTEIDFYEENLVDNVNNTYASSWSTLKYDDLQETCFTIFKGVKYKLDDKNLDGYRFSVILKSDIIRETSNGFDVDYIKNDKYKTFTIILYFYIPEPILTTLEGGIPYFVDRSLLYFSNEIYTTRQSQINFGESTISLDLFNTTILKTYNGFESTKNWLIYNETISKHMMYVHKGSSSRFNTSFTEILELNGEFTCEFTDSDSMDSPYFGMKMVFGGIVEIANDGFWCTEVTIFTVTTSDIDGVPDKFIDDDIVDNKYEIDIMQMLLADQTLINKVNLLYYTKFIAYELFTYNKIVTSSANNIRYQSITLANFSSALDLKLIANPYNVSAIISDGFYTPISIEAVDNETSSELRKLEIPYFYPMYRYEGSYVPLLQTIYDFDKSGKTINSNTVVDYMKFQTILDNDYVVNKLVSRYDKSILSKNTENHKYLVSTQDNIETYLDLPWSIFPNEKRNFSSICFNSEENLIDYAVNTNEILFVDVCKFKHFKWLNLLQSTITTNEKVLATFYKHSTGSAVTISDMYNKSVSWFIKNLFFKIYKIKNVVDSSNNSYEFLLEDEKIVILGPENASYIITYNR